jgi:hypothetical protein
MPDQLFTGIPDGTGEAEKSDPIVGGEGGAELKVIKGGYYYSLYPLRICTQVNASSEQLRKE